MNTELLPASAHIPAQSSPPSHGSLAACTMSVTVVERADDLTEHVPAWQELAGTALEPNAFYEPWMLLPALRAFGAGTRLLFLLVHATDKQQPRRPPLLCGLFPLEQSRGYKGIPLRLLRLWKPPYCSLCTPLVRADGADACLDAVFDWLATDRRSAALLDLPFLVADGPFCQRLHRSFNQHGTFHWAAESFTRALYQPQTDAETYLGTALSTKRRKELRRLERRLGETGPLDYTMLQAGDDLEAWLDDFLRLEASGWKGKQGTAFAAHDTDRAFFREVVRGAARQGRLQMLGLRCGDRPIALKCNFLAPPGAFAFKIAYDEEFARFSPGVQLEIANMEQLQAQRQVRWMDSCAIPDHFMINRLWLERRTIQSLVVSTGKTPGDLVVSLLPLLKWIKRKFVPRQPIQPPT